MGKKFVLCSLLMLINRGSTLQVFVGCIFSFCTFSIQTLVKPYKTAADNILKGCAEAQLFCTFLGCLVLRLEAADTSGYDVVLIVLNLLVYPLPFLLVVAAPTCWNLKHFLSRAPGRSHTPVHPMRNSDFLDDQMRDLDGKPLRDLDGDRFDKDTDMDDKSSQRSKKADWKTVTRAGQLKWSKTYRVGNSEKGGVRSSGSKSDRDSGSGGSSMGGRPRGVSASPKDSDISNGSRGGGLSPSKESTKRSPGKPAKLKALPKKR